MNQFYMIVSYSKDFNTGRIFLRKTLKSAKDLQRTMKIEDGFLPYILFWFKTPESFDGLIPIQVHTLCDTNAIPWGMVTKTGFHEPSKHQEKVPVDADVMRFFLETGVNVRWPSQSA